MMPPGVRIEDPCAYCGRPIRDVARAGCGSQEYRDAEVDRLCHIADWVRRRVGPARGA